MAQIKFKMLNLFLTLCPIDSHLSQTENGQLKFPIDIVKCPQTANLEVIISQLYLVCWTFNLHIHFINLTLWIFCAFEGWFKKRVVL